ASRLAGTSLASEPLLGLHAFGLTPPFMLALLASPTAWAEWSGSEWSWALRPIIQGLTFWALGAVGLALVADRAFLKRTCQGPSRAPGSKNCGAEITKTSVRGWARRLVKLGTALAVLGVVGAWYLSQGSTSRPLAEAIAEADHLD